MTEIIYGRARVRTAVPPLDDLERANRRISNLEERLEKLKEKNKSLKRLLTRALKAICLTRDYVGEDKLPAIEGWEWYDVGLKICNRVPNSDWAEQFKLRVEKYEISKKL